MEMDIMRYSEYDEATSIKGTDLYLVAVDNGNTTYTSKRVQASNVVAIKLANRITVGASGSYTTLKAAVDWFNASATSDTEILLDAGHHSISDTVTVNNSTYTLQIRGLGSAVTYLEAATGLTGKPMFKLKTACDLNKMTCTGSTLSSYGTSTSEDCIMFDGTSNIYSELTDILMDTFKICVVDTVGVDIFLFNFLISDCGTGVSVNYATTSIPDTMIDAEVGNFENCTVGIDLVKAEGSNFLLTHLVFLHTGAQTAIRYDGANFIYKTVSNIFNCTYNDIGTFLSGFDFKRSDGRDANIIVLGNVGQEPKTPHAKLNTVDNAVTTTVTSAGTYYKVQGINSKQRIVFNNAATAGHFHITVDTQTTGEIAWDASIATIKTAVEALSNVTTVTVTQIVASKEWTILFTTADEGFSTMTVDVSALTTTTTATVYPSYYNCKFTVTSGKIVYQPTNVNDVQIWLSFNVATNQTTRNVDVCIRKTNSPIMNYGNMTVRCPTQNQYYAGSSVVYIPDVLSGDTFEIYCTSSTDGDVVTMSDMTVYASAR